MGMGGTHEPKVRVIVKFFFTSFLFLFPGPYFVQYYAFLIIK
jgi:hypothetical protein